MTEDLGFRSPLDAEALRAALATHATPGLERQEADGAHVRALAAPGGPATARIGIGPTAVTAELELGDPEDRGWVMTALRRWLDLDADPEPIDAVLRRDPRLRPAVEAHPGVRALGCLDPFETVVLTVLGQQVSVKAARTFGARLIEAFGVARDDGFASFPTPAALRTATPDEIQSRVGITHGRVRTVQALADSVSERSAGVVFDDPSTRREALLAIPGIGPWTVEYLELRLGDKNALPAGDLVLQRSLGVGSAAEAEAAAEPWRPWRAYGLFSLWTSTVFLPERSVSGPHRATSPPPV